MRKMRSIIKETCQGNTRLDPGTKSSDRIICNSCGIGIMEPHDPDAEINHGFTCSNCGAHANFDFADTVVD